MSKVPHPDFTGWTTIENLKCEDGRDAGIDPQFFRVHNLFAQVTYKPGTRIVVEAGKKQIVVSVWIPTVDSYHQDVPYDGRFYLWATYELLAQQSDDELLMWLMHNVTAFETHEAMEFFKVGGKHVRNPHPFDSPLHGAYMKDHAMTWDLQPKEKPSEIREH